MVQSKKLRTSKTLNIFWMMWSSSAAKNIILLAMLAMVLGLEAWGWVKKVE